MATIVFYPMSLLVTDYVMGSSGTQTPPASWTMALSVSAVGSGSNMMRVGTWNVANTTPNFGEIGSTAAAGYARVTIARSIAQGAIDWLASSPDPTFATGGYSTTADQVTFSFTGAPNPGSLGSPANTNSWVLTTGAPLNAGAPYFAADTAAPRVFANGDTEKVTATLKAG